jgi:hypothetical protein
VSVQLTVRVAHGYVALGLSDSLQYELTPGGIAQGAFACEHRKPIVPINGPGNHTWRLATSGMAGPNVFLVDQGPGVYDVYVATMLFAQAKAYTLRIIRQPANLVVQDIDFASNAPTDIYHQPLLVERV